MRVSTLPNQVLGRPAPEDAATRASEYDGPMIEPATTGPAPSDAAAREPDPAARDLQDADAGASRADPRAGGHAEEAPRSLHSVELVADDEPIASNDE